MRFTSFLLGAALVAASLLLAQAPASATHGALSGKVTDLFGTALNQVCVTIGPPVRCVTMTKVDGTWFVDLAGAPDGLTWDVRFLIGGVIKKEFLAVVVNGPTIVNAQIDTGSAPPPPPVPVCTAARADNPTATNYLPNVTKTLGGPTGFQTPFIVQNTGTATASLEVSWYKFADGSCAKRISIDRAPGTSYAYVPNNDASLPDNTQFSVVVRSYGSTAVSVVNEHQGVGDRAEALSYDGFSGGATRVFLPNVTRRFCAGCRAGSGGFVTPFVIQNLGSGSTTATAQFQERGGSGSLSIIRVIEPGRSQFVDPNSTLGLVDGKAYAVTVTADQPVAVVVNTHDDASTVAQPIAYSTDGIAEGAATLYAPYAAKNTDGVGRVSSIVVQNVGTLPASPTLKFTALGGGTPTSFSLGNVESSKAAAFDPRYTNGDTNMALCGTGASTGCLADGEYTVEISAAGGSLAAAVSVLSTATAMGYSAITKAGAKYFLPNVTRTLGGATGWTTPIMLQSATATSAALSWYRFSDGVLVTTQTVPLSAGSGTRIDPRTVPGTTDDTQYAVVVQASGGNVAAIVVEMASGGDNAMIYEGFAVP